MGLKELAEKLQADGTKFETEWKGYKVYALRYKEPLIIGCPTYILEKDGEYRLTTPQEGFDILDYTIEQDDSEES